MASVVGVTELLNITVTPTPGVVQDTNTQQVNGNTVDTGTGAAGAGTQRVALATGSTVAATQSGTWNIGSMRRNTTPVFPHPTQLMLPITPSTSYTLLVCWLLS